MSGVFKGKTTGTPILLIALNENFISEEYSELKNIYRPSHADYTYDAKYGFRDWRGGGRSSARETLARVAAGAIAKKYLKKYFGIEFLSYVEEVGNIQSNINHNKVTLKQIEQNIIRCPDKSAANKMIKLINKLKLQGDSVGGVIKGVIKNIIPGLGEPVFDKLNSDLGRAMLCINAVKGFEIGSGFSGTKLKGSEHNDKIIYHKKIKTKTNFSGGIVGGISNGETIYFRVAFKPVSTIKKLQKSIDVNKKEVKFSAEGRHDPCVLPRAVPIIDAMAALVVMDHYLRHKAQNL